MGCLNSTAKYKTGLILQKNLVKIPFLTSSVADPDPGSGAILTHGSGMAKNQDLDPESGSGLNIPDHISESLETIFWVKILKFLTRKRIRE
jgi:hypothetical protein